LFFHKNIAVAHGKTRAQGLSGRPNPKIKECGT